MCSQRSADSLIRPGGQTWGKQSLLNPSKKSPPRLSQDITLEFEISKYCIQFIVGSRSRIRTRVRIRTEVVVHSTEVVVPPHLWDILGESKWDILGESKWDILGESKWDTCGTCWDISGQES